MELMSLREKKIVGIILILLLVFLIALQGVYHFMQTHFLYGTIIEGVDCTFLSVEKALEKVEMQKREEIVKFHFTSGKTYDLAFKELDMQIDETGILQIFERQHQNPEEERVYNLDGFILVDTELLRNLFKQIPELQKENMVEPENAYIIWDEIEFSIQKEKLGNVIDFEEAIIFATEELKSGKDKVDFLPVTKVNPEVMTEDLASERDELNSILNSSINFELTDGSIVSLDSNTIKTWVYQDEEGKFAFDVEKGVIEFVEYLATKVNDANANMKFAATDCEKLATVNVPMAVRAQLDKERQISEIKELLGNPEPITLTPIYNRKLISDMLTSYIEIDLTRQHIWFYLNGTLIVDTPCVTGNIRDGYGTPTGVFFMLNKNRKVYLEGFNKDGSKYSSFVEYWIRFFEGIGMHDAPWRSNFGGDIHINSGSHGCINMPEWAAAITYENIDDTMPIIVYQSEC